MPDEHYLKGAADLCRRYGTLFVADEVQTGLGRTGRFLAIEHWNVERDMILLAKTLSGGHVPVGANASLMQYLTAWTSRFNFRGQ